MRCAANVVVVASIVAVARGLIIDRRGAPDLVVANGSKELASTGNASAQHPDTSFYACSGSHCTVNNTKMKADLQSGLILFLGCSLDIYAIKHFCTAAHAPLIGFDNNFAYMAHCTMGSFTLVYVFQPGATGAPYWRDYVGTLDSYQIIAKSTKDVVQKFGQEPTAIVVDASLWDVSNWWLREGTPPEPYPVPHDYISSWCHTDLPHLLQKAQDSYPHTKIAFRTPPPVFVGNEYGQSPPIVDEMVKCVRGKVDFVNKMVYSKYHMIDFNALVGQFFLHHPGPQLNFYADVLHPGEQLSMAYMNEVLQWVRGFHR
jgi:hypothetical protein